MRSDTRKISLPTVVIVTGGLWQKSDAFWERISVITSCLKRKSRRKVLAMAVLTERSSPASVTASAG